MKQLTLGFAGFGLIGGSIARSLKASRENTEIIVYSRRENPDLEQGKQDGIIDQIVYSIDNTFHRCDVIFLCAPVLINIELLKQLKPIISPHCILTDVGSVKGNIHKAVKELEMEGNFIGGHPMAGSEKTGYIHSSTTLLENAYYFLTPTSKTPKEDLTFLSRLVSGMGSTCVVLDEKEHDDITAAISHVPHIIATSLVNMVRLSDNDQENMKHFAAGGFRDITRIASSSPEIWESICLSNKDSISKFLDKYMDLLKQFKSYVMDGDGSGISQYFHDAGEYRNSIPSRQSSLISQVYEIFVDVKDQTGVLANIATLLANAQISIKNIGIVKNREFTEGALRIELNDKESKEKAISQLGENGYKIILR